MDPWPAITAKDGPQRQGRKSTLRKVVRPSSLLLLLLLLSLLLPKTIIVSMAFDYTGAVAGGPRGSAEPVWPNGTLNGERIPFLAPAAPSLTRSAGGGAQGVAAGSPGPLRDRRPSLFRNLRCPEFFSTGPLRAVADVGSVNVGGSRTAGEGPLQGPFGAPEGAPGAPKGGPQKGSFFHPAFI